MKRPTSTALRPLPFVLTAGTVNRINRAKNRLQTHCNFRISVYNGYRKQYASNRSRNEVLNMRSKSTALMEQISNYIGDY